MILRCLRIALVLCAALASAADLYAARREAFDYFTLPQFGGWFGPITPLHTTNRVVDTKLGGGIFLRVNTPFDPLKLGLDGSYQHYTSTGVNELTLWPVYGSAIYRIPIRFALNFQLKAGAGACLVKIKPDRREQWDPMGMLGFEAAFPAGRFINIGLRIDYLYIYEGYIKGAHRNGHVLNTGITLYFNLGKK